MLFGNNDRWQPMLNKCCPKCESKNIEYDSAMVLTSYPPKYSCRCNSCGEYFFSDMDSVTNMTSPNICDPLPGQASYFGGNQGWICPKCGRVMAPHMDYCKFCSSSNEVTINTNKLDGNDKLNLEKLVEDWKNTLEGDPFIYRTKLGDVYYNWLTTTNSEMNGTNKMDISVQNNKIDIKDMYMINTTMADKFLAESDSVFEAVNKYKEWEKNNRDENSELYSKP